MPIRRRSKGCRFFSGPVQYSSGPDVYSTESVKTTYMRTLTRNLFVTALAVFALCSCGQDGTENPFVGQVIHTGCSKDTKAASDVTADPTLTLEYTNDGLRLVRTYTEMNCSIKNGGIVCDVSVDGRTVHYSVYEKDGPSANCICVVDQMTTVIPGLSEGVEYTLDYSVSGVHYSPIDFTYTSNLVKIIDLDLFIQP